jgi:ribulose 1,5-bisphosphate synthetase/thiazole synthase
MDDNELKHYGILGMRWGVRRKRQGPDSEDSVRARAHLKKNVNEMSNKELREANERIRLEQEHKNLTKNASVGKKVIAGIVVAGTTLAAINTLYQQSAKFGNNAKNGYNTAVNKVGDKMMSQLGNSYKKNPYLTN